MGRRSKPYFHPVRGQWRVRINNKDVFAPKAIGPKDEAGAWAWLESLKGGAKVEVAKVPGRVTLEALANAYLSWLKVRVDCGRHKKHSFDCCRSNLKAFCGYRGYGKKPAADLNMGMLHEFLDHRRKTVTANTARNMARSVQRVLNWACEPQPGRELVRLIESNPIRGRGCRRSRG